MRSKILSIYAAAAALTISSAHATVWITSDRGGLVSQYVQHFASLRHSGETVVIDGPCHSACTMVLGYIPPERVCITGKAVFGFHAAYLYDPIGRKVTSAAGTQVLWNSYPQRIRSWIARRGGLKPKMMYLRGRELASMYPRCR